MPISITFTGETRADLLDQIDAFFDDVSLSGETDDNDEKPAPKRRTRKKAEPKADAPEAKPETTPEPEAPKLTLDDVRNAMAPLIQKGPALAIAIVKEMGAVDDKGNAQIKLLAEDKYAEAIELANAKVAELDKAAEGLM